MKKIIQAALMVSAIGMAVVSASNGAYAQQDYDRYNGGQRPGVQLNLGGIAFGYRDGYWDRDHGWHSWGNGSQARQYQQQYGGNYRNYDHTRDPNQGWRDNGGQRPSVQLNLGDIAFGYRDGYWDRDHGWHSWGNGSQARQYQQQYGGNYRNYDHTRDPNQGWRDNGRRER